MLRYLTIVALAGAAVDPASAAPPPLVRVVTPISPAPAPGPARARAHLPSLFSTMDYPMQALRNGEQGTVGFAVSISAAGRVTDCRVTASSGSASLDTATCAIIQRRARFSPARDAQGRTVPDSSSGRIRWVLPPPAVVPWAKSHATVAFAIGASRQIEGCVDGVGAAIAGKDFGCGPMQLQAYRYLAAIPADVAMEGRQLVFETALMVDGPNPMPTRAEAELLRVEAQVKVDPDGKVACTVTVDEHRFGPKFVGAPPCPPGLQFTPLPTNAANRKMRYGTLRRALYVQHP